TFPRQRRCAHSICTLQSFVQAVRNNTNKPRLRILPSYSPPPERHPNWTTKDSLCLSLVVAGRRPALVQLDPVWIACPTGVSDLDRKSTPLLLQQNSSLSGLVRMDQNQPWNWVQQSWVGGGPPMPYSQY